MEFEDYDPAGTFWVEVRADQSTPERRLMLAIIEDSVRNYLNEKTRTRRRTLWLSEREWLFSDSDHCLFGVSFKYACHAVGLDPDGIRRQLATAQPRAKRRHPRVGGSRHKIGVAA